MYIKMSIMRSQKMLVCLAAVACVIAAEARALTREDRRLQQMAPPPMPAGPPVTASATKAPAPYVVDPWSVGMTYSDVSVMAGQSVEFKWPGRHGVYVIMNSTCPTVFDDNGPNVLSPIKANGDYTTPSLKAGSYYFTCQVPGHCDDGQVVHVTAA